MAWCGARLAASVTIVSNRMFSIVLALSAVFVVVAPIIAILEFDSRRYVECVSILALWAGAIAAAIYGVIS